MGKWHMICDLRRILPTDRGSGRGNSVEWESLESLVGGLVFFGKCFGVCFLAFGVCKTSPNTPGLQMVKLAVVMIYTLYALKYWDA